MGMKVLAPTKQSSDISNTNGIPQAHRHLNLAVPSLRQMCIAAYALKDKR